jgi:glucose/mannose transport system substrate-binding protein
MNFKRLVLATAISSASASVCAADVEVLHYWASGGEAKSAIELKKIMRAQGFGWKDFAVFGGAGENANTALKARVISGNLPTAAQIKGPAIQAWGAEGVLANIDDAAKAGKWDALLPKVVTEVMKYKGHYVAVPVNVHRVNWVWANPDVLKKAGVTGVPANWDEFLAAAEKIKQSGAIAVAHGGQPWQDATVFESIALGVGGPAFYQKSLVKLDNEALTSATMQKVFDTLGKYKSYIDKDAAGRDWNVATAMVIKGKAAFQFMGDWAKGEFTAANKVPGKDFLCAPAPGTAKAYTFNIDSFAMFTQKTDEAKKAQAALAGAMMSPAFQEVFNLNKGSIPVRPDIPRAKFDVCATQSMDDMAATNKSNSLVPSFAHGMAVASATQGAMVDVIAKFMNSSMSSKDAVAQLAKAAKVK